MILKAPHRVESIWPAIRSLWHAYSQKRGFQLDEAGREMRAAANFAAARLVLTAFEMSIRMPNVTRTSAVALQLATAMMAAPDIAVRDILGLTQAEKPN